MPHVCHLIDTLNCVRVSTKWENGLNWFLLFNAGVFLCFVCCAPFNCHIDWFKRMPVILLSHFYVRIREKTFNFTHKKSILHDVFFCLVWQSLDGITDKTSIVLYDAIFFCSSLFVQGNIRKQSINMYTYEMSFDRIYLIDGKLFWAPSTTNVHTKWILKTINGISNGIR